MARAALHFWEEPPISGDAGSGTVFFSYCPLHCVYCQNFRIANGNVGRDIDVGRLSRIFIELQEQGALNINLVTPTHYVLQILDALDAARDLGLRLPVVYNTSGYECPDTIAMLEGYVDLFLADFRYYDADAAGRYSHAADYPVVAFDAIRAMVETGADVIVRILLLPGQLEHTKQAVSLLSREFGDSITFSMMSQYTPVEGIDAVRYPELTQRVSAADYEELLDYMDAIGIEDYFWQDGDAAEESFIPDFESCEGVEASSVKRK